VGSRLGLESIRVLGKNPESAPLWIETSAFSSSCLNFFRVMSPFSRLIGDVDGVVALPCVMHSAGGCASCNAMVRKRCSGTQAFRTFLQCTAIIVRGLVCDALRHSVRYSRMIGVCAMYAL